MQSRRRSRVALLGGAVLALGLLAGLSGAAARPSHGMGNMTMGSMGNMTMGSMGNMAMGAMTTAPSSGTVTRLHQKVVHVTILNFAFTPARLVVSPGTRIIWTNQDSDPHTVQSTKHIWASDALDTGGQFARVFKKAGTFPYYCSIHPYMHGTIIVKK